MLRGVITALALLGALAPAARAQEARIAVAVRDLPRGAVLTRADIAFRTVPSARRAPASVEPGPGWVTQRVVRAGEELRPPAVSRPNLITAGETVEVRYAGAALLMTLRGVAARSPGEGERTWVRLGTGWRVEGTVVGPATIEIQSPGGRNAGN